MKRVRVALGGVAERLASISLPELPRLGREAVIPVYVVHNSGDAEDYFFIFDFEEFVVRSREGVFVRPRLRVIAGRDDFDRADFARQFRESFAREFDAARAALEAQGAGGGWFSWMSGLGKEIVGGPLTGFVANVVLLVALSAGRMVLSQILPKGLMQGKSDAMKLEDNIEATKKKVDDALAAIDLVLHRDLSLHAHYGVLPAHLAARDFDVWPLPGFVRNHLEEH